MCRGFLLAVDVALCGRHTTTLAGKTARPHPEAALRGRLLSEFRRLAANVAPAAGQSSEAPLRPLAEWKLTPAGLRHDWYLLADVGPLHSSARNSALSGSAMRRGSSRSMPAPAVPRATLPKASGRLGPPMADARQATGTRRMCMNGSLSKRPPPNMGSGTPSRAASKRHSYSKADQACDTFDVRADLRTGATIPLTRAEPWACASSTISQTSQLGRRRCGS
mmetsp:Transcript_141464/g.452187  ORF Transcript_141464/g.452187 Transcript_141464/m.452187 type:complete len:222 (+) Transcript_141464:724-1389(+)